MNLDYEYNHKLLNNLDDIIQDLGNVVHESRSRIGIEFGIKIHNLKHQLSFFKRKPLIQLILELEKIFVRVIRCDYIVECTQVQKWLNVLKYIQTNLESEDVEQDKTYYWLFEDLKNTNQAYDLAEKKQESILKVSHEIGTLKQNTSVNYQFKLEELSNIYHSTQDLQKLLFTLEDTPKVKEGRAIVESFMASISKIRICTLQELANKLHFIVNSVACDCGKIVRTHMHIDDSLIDQMYLDLLIDPVMQIIKNNIIHGIEPIQERKEKGKTAFGNLYFNLYTIDDLFYLEISNDGKKLDIQSLVKHNYYKDLVLDTEEQKANLIFEPFISTKDEISETGGSGLGLTGVRYRIEQLNGTIHVVSNDEYTTFKITLPRYYTSQAYHVFKVGNVYFALLSCCVKANPKGSDFVDLPSLDIRFDQSLHCKVQDRSFICKIHDQDTIFIFEKLYRNVLLEKHFHVGQSVTLHGCSRLFNDQAVLILSENVIRKIDKFFDTLLQLNIIFADKDENRKIIPIHNIIKIMLIDKKEINFEKVEYEVTYQDVEEVITKTFIQILDITM